MTKQSSQTPLLIGIGAITAAVIGGYFGLDYLSGKKAVATETASAATTTPPAEGDYSAAIASATEAAMAGATGNAPLTAKEAARIGAEVAKQVAAQVAQAIVDQKAASSTGGASDGGGGLTEAEARRIGEEEGRRVAQEVAATTVQEALAAAGGSGSGGSTGGLTAAEAEEIGLAAGRRAAQQVAASTARDVVRNEFGGAVAAKTEPKVRHSTPKTPEEAPAAEVVSTPASSHSGTSAKTAAGAGSDALRAWWSAPASGDFGIVYAGQPQGEGAIALLFSGEPAANALNENIKVYDAKGNIVSGNWEAAANPRLAVLRGLQPGRYTVVVGAALADASGKAINKAQHGPVYVI